MKGGTNGGNGQGDSTGTYLAGLGQGSTTKEFGEASGTLYSGGGAGETYTNGIPAPIDDTCGGPTALQIAEAAERKAETAAAGLWLSETTGDTMRKKPCIPKMKDGNRHILISITFDGKKKDSEKDFCWHGCDKVSRVGNSGGGGS